MTEPTAGSTAELDRAWSVFSDRIKAAGESIVGPDFPDDPRLRAEGYRYVMRLAAQAHYLFVEFADTVRPTLFPRGGDVFAYGATNVDNNNYRCMVDPGGVYRVTGNVGGVREFIASVYEGEFVLGKPAVLAEVQLSGLHVDADGMLELFLGGPERPRNWMPLTPDSTYFGVRQFIEDWEHDPIATLHIERLDEIGPVENLTPESLVDALDQAATWVEANVRVWNLYSNGAEERTPVNGFNPPAYADGGSNAMAHGGTIWQLESEHTLVIEIDRANASYWNIQNYVLHWLQPLDFIDRVTSFNSEQVHVDVDGKVRVVLAHADPGVQNWLDTSGLARGMCSSALDRCNHSADHHRCTRRSRQGMRPPTGFDPHVHARRSGGTARRPPSRCQPSVPPMTPVTTTAEVHSWFDTLSNWGRWGDDDQLGTLNHISPDARRRGAKAVRHGESVSCAWDLDTATSAIQRSTFAMPFVAELARSSGMEFPGSHDERWGVASETLSFQFHGVTHTHLDSPAHMFWDGLMYGGRSADLVDATDGATWCAVTAAADGLVTRGVLLDIPPVRNVGKLGPGDGVGPDDLEAAERRQGVRVEPGDAVLLRTGDGKDRHVRDGSDPSQAGWHASCLPWLHDRQVAYIGADTANDVQPSGVEGVFMPIHSVGLVAMGLWLVDNCDLELCAATAERLQQWDFLLTVSPIRFVGTSGSPVNPIATF